MNLRPYQTGAIEGVRDAMRRARAANKQARTLVVAPTGAGKTVIFSTILCRALANGARSLVLAHRRELIDQTVDKLIAAGVAQADVGVIMGNDSRRRPTARVQVASVQTLVNRARPPADIVVVDEAHRALAKSYVDIASAYPQAAVLGFTATPWRVDGKGLGHLFEDLVVVAQVPGLVRDGYLVPTRVYSHPRRPDLSKLRTTGGDYDMDQAAGAMSSTLLLGDMVEHYRAHGEGKPAFYFGCTVEHSQLIAEQFNAAGIPAAHVDGETPDEERAAALEGLRTGRFKVVSNCNVFTEGTDVPCVKIIGLMRPTKSRALAFQMMGRAMRPFEGETYCTVLDHAGVVQTHGHPGEEQDYSLEDRKKRKGTGETPTKTCPECGLECPAGAKECECGWVFVIERALPDQVEGRLVEIAPRVAVVLSDAEEEQGYRSALGKALEREGIRDPKSYARGIFTRRFGRAPSPAVCARVESVLLATWRAPEREKMPAWLREQLSGGRVRTMVDEVESSVEIAPDTMFRPDIQALPDLGERVTVDL